MKASRAQIVCIGVISILILSPTAFAAASCFGVPTDAPRNEICMNQTSESACFSKLAYESEFIFASCRWSTTTGAVTKNIQSVYTRYGTTWLSGVEWPKGVTSLSLKVTLPPSAKNKWSGYLSLQSGPGNSSAPVRYTDPKRSFTFSGCQTGTTCEIKQTVPKNVFPSATFKNTSLTFTAITTDPVLINQFKTNDGYLDDTYPFKLKLETTYTTAAGKPASTPAISDLVQFGPTSYIMEKDISPIDPKTHYSVVTYKSYEITNVVEANWKVTVGASVPFSGKKTNMTSMLMTELAYNQYFGLKQQYLGKCTTTCKPPTNLAIKGTVCAGVTCTGKAKLLKTFAKYRLVVSYPTIASLSSSKAYSTSPMTSSFNKQMVKTEIFGKGWKLVAKKAPTSSSSSSSSSSSAGSGVRVAARIATTTTLI